MNNTDIESTSKVRAVQFRRNYGLSESGPIDIFKVLREWLDISIIFKPFSSTLSGIFMRLDSTQVIVINTAKTLGHQKFTAAHEFFHLEYDRGMTHRICVPGLFNQSSQNEREADYFAANLLIPAEAVSYRLQLRLNKKRKLTIEDIIDLEQHFSVSHSAMLIRLRQLDYLTTGEMESFKPQIITKAKILGYDTALYQPTHEDRIYSTYAEKSKRALEKGLITDGKYEQLLLEAGLADLLYESETGDNGVNDEEI
jgi:Zn-dependent peptidase ImmA (M78 family)